MTMRRFAALAAMTSMLAGCGGGGGDSTPTATAPVAGGTGSTSGSGSTACSVAARQEWVAGQIRENYLFPETLPATNPTGIANVSDFVDALTATARAQRRDRFFTYVTSIAQENAFFSSGSSAGFGFRLSYDTTNNRVFVNESFEGTTALAAGVDRGAEVIAIGTDAGNLQTVSSLMASGGPQAVVNALGPSTVGTARVLRVTDATGTRNVTLTKTDYALTPVSARYGAKIIDDAGKRVGYINLRTFIDTSEPALRSAFQQFRDAGVTEVVVDVRYNGGGLVSIADLFVNLFGRNRSTSDTISVTTTRSSSSTTRFAPQAQSIAPTKLAFIGAGGTASASELVINAMRPYVSGNIALVGSNTFGKPVGQIARDLAACDDRLRVVAFSTQNAAGQGFYYDGLASVMEQTCRAADDIAFPLGDPREASLAAALNFLGNRGTCTRISEAARTTLSAGSRAAATQARLELITPDRPDAPQREVPGSF